MKGQDIMTPEEAVERADKDCESLKEYHLAKETMDSIKKFYDYKKKFLLNRITENSIYMKNYFQEAHSELKVECSCGRISRQTLNELTEFLKNDL